MVTKVDTFTSLIDSPVIKDEGCLAEVSGAEIALEHTEVLEVDDQEEKWTSVTSERKNPPRGVSLTKSAFKWSQVQHLSESPRVHVSLCPAPAHAVRFGV